MKLTHTLLAAGIAMLSMAQSASAQENILAEKGIFPLGGAKTWYGSDGTSEYIFKTEDLQKLVAVPTNTSNVFLFPENDALWNTAENKEIGIQGFYIDLEATTAIGTVTTTWEGAAANSYDIYLTNVEPTISILETTPTYTASKLGQYTSNTAVLPEGSEGRYLVFQPTDATNWGWGVKIRSISATAPADDILSTFKVTPGIVVSGRETPVNFTILNQFGLEMSADDVTITVSDNATLANGNITITSGDYATITATDGDVTMTATIYVAVAPEVPAASSIKTPIYSNTITDYNATAEWTTAYNGGANNLGEIVFDDEEVAWQFGSTQCVFFSNSVTTGAWNGNINPEENGYRQLCLDVFSATDSDCTIEFESVTGLDSHTFPFSLTAGEWNHLSVDVAGATKLGNLSIRFTESNMADILLANIYFTPAYVEGDETAPVLDDIVATATMTSIELTLKATDAENPEVYYSISDGTKTYSATGKSGEEITYTINALQPSTTYNITVVASDGLNTSEPKSIEVKTLGFPDSPKPTVNEDHVVVVYSSGYGVDELPAFDSWGSTATMETITTDNGSKVLLFNNYQDQWGGIVNLNLDVANATSLYIDIFSDNAGSIDIAPVWADATGDTPGKTVTISEDETGMWNTIVIPVSEFGYPDYGYGVIQIALTKSSLQSFAIDNLFFAGETSLVVDTPSIADPETVNVYNLQGVCVKEGVKASEAASLLPAGLYIIGNKKVIVK